MAEKKIQWTQQQLHAITARGSDILVSASAGTGKTAVLSGRCVDIVSDAGICPDVGSIVVLTFTEAAAEQMRQFVLLQGADISTIHSFCKRLITQYFYKLGLDPTFRIIDEDEQRLIKSDVLEKTLDWAWRQSNLTQPLQQLLRRRDLRTTEGFPAKVIAVSNFLDGVISRENWYERAQKIADLDDPFNCELGDRQKHIIATRLQQILEQLEHCLRIYTSECPDGDWLVLCRQTVMLPVEQCLQLAQTGDWDACAQRITNFEKPTVRKPKGPEESIAELIQQTVRKALDSFQQLKDMAVLNPDYVDKVGRTTAIQTRVMVELVRKFDQLYAKAKKVLNCLDFADLEHYALRLLTDDENPSDETLPSDTAIALQRKYRYIFVDEYQDINLVQQSILDKLSSGGNVFVVGDVKQSIYAWRGAEPEIFLKRLKSASKDPANGLRIDLNTSFRSAKGVLDFVNAVFARIMTGPVARMDYDESAILNPPPDDESKKATACENGCAVELHILDELNKNRKAKQGNGDRPGQEDKSSVISSRQRQAAMIAQRIRQMVGEENGKSEFAIYDSHQDKNRGVEYRDIVILMRSLAGKADFVEVLKMAGVPVNCDAIAGYFETTEISDILSLLKVLDNPQRDIELAAVLRSPIFKITDTQLAKIRLHAKTTQTQCNLYDSVIKYSTDGADSDLVGRLKEAIQKTDQWRSIARRGNLAELIWQIYRETGFLSFVSALANGRTRRANLLKLHDRAIQFEGFAGSVGIASLKRFVEFIEKLQQMGQDWAPAAADSSMENAVRILSVHKSKGLEFPVVFLAELNSRFNKRDIYDDCLVDDRDTVGLRIVDDQSKGKLRSLAHQVIAEHKQEISLAEEMRILYVATTRARQRLVLTACRSGKSCRRILRDGFASGTGPVPQWQLRSCNSPFEWLLYGLCDRKNIHDAFETGLADKTIDDNLFSIRLYDQQQLQQFNDKIIKLRTGRSRRSKTTTSKTPPKQPQNQLLSKLRNTLDWRYQFEDIPHLPAKQSVSQLTHAADEYYVRDGYSRALERKPAVLEPDQTKHAPARLIGTATHLLIAELDLTTPITIQHIEQTKQKLLADGAINELIAAGINCESIMKFFQSPQGRLALDNADALLREWSFTFSMPASEWPEAAKMQILEYGDETIIVQGIIDMIIPTPQGLIVIDFKTDRVNADQVRERAENYRRPLQLYARAASTILRTETSSKWLYFLTPGCSVQV